MIAPFPLLLAPNFPELAPKWRAVPDGYATNASNMLRLVQRARSLGGVPVRVSSWYRPPTLNTLRNGSKSSQHLTASAMDLVPQGDVHDFFLKLAGGLPPDSFGQMIFERDHVHLSLPNRANGRTGEILTEPSEGTFLVWPGQAADDSREGSTNTATAALLLALFGIIYLTTGGGRG